MHPRAAALAMALALLATSIGRAATAADPTGADCVSASNASVALHADHKLRQERALLLVCAAGSCPAEVRAECARRMDQVTAAMPTIVFVARDSTGAELSAVKVTVDGEVVADHLDGVALALDPGRHQLTFEAAGQAPVTRTIILHEGEKERHEVLVVAGPVPPPVAPAVAPASLPAAPSTPPAHHEGHPAHTLAFVVGGAGIAGVIAGGISGALGFSSWGSANGECPSHTGCSSSAVQDRSNAETFATVSTVALIAGGVLLAGGITLYFAAPKDAAPTAGVRIGPGGVSVDGAF